MDFLLLSAACLHLIGIQALKVVAIVAKLSIFVCYGRIHTIQLMRWTASELWV
jgi:hypothetical protein